MEPYVFLEKLYIHRFEVGTNIHYHTGLAVSWNRVAFGAKVGIIVFTVGTLILAIAQSVAPKSPLSIAAEGAPSIAVAAAAALIALFPLILDPAEKSREYHSSRERWHEIRNDLTALENDLLVAKFRPTKSLVDRLTAVDTAKGAIQLREPVETHQRWLSRCWEREMVSLYGVSTENDVMEMRSANPEKWARLRYGIPIDGDLLERIVCHFGT